MARIGDTCTIVVESDELLTNYHVNWSFKDSLVYTNSVPVKKDRKYFITNTGSLFTLTVPRVRLEDFGDYSVSFGKDTFAESANAVIQELKLNCKFIEKFFN